MKFINNKGFTLIEVLLACSILSSSIVFIVPIMKSASSLIKDNRFSDDKIQIHQIRLILACSKNIIVSKNYVTCNYLDENIELKFHRNRIVKTPGYEIILENLDQAYFSENNNCIYLHWRRNNYEKQVLVGLQS